MRAYHLNDFCLSYLVLILYRAARILPSLHSSGDQNHANAPNEESSASAEPSISDISRSAAGDEESDDVAPPPPPQPNNTLLSEEEALDAADEKYLLRLEEILISLHHAYFKKYDKWLATTTRGKNATVLKYVPCVCARVRVCYG